MIAEETRQDPVASAVLGRFPDAVQDAKIDFGELTLMIEPAEIVEVCRFLKQQEKFVRLSAVTCVDWHPSEQRFELVYQLESLERNLRVRLKSRVDAEIDSVTVVWRGANWYEREIFDLFGVGFRGHPDLTRIMMPEGWQGHPLRKDYPVHGYKYSYADQQ